MTSNYEKDNLIGFSDSKNILYDIILKSNHFIFSFEKILYKINFFDPRDKNKMRKVLTPWFSSRVIPWKKYKTKKIIYTLIPYETCFLWLETLFTGKVYKDDLCNRPAFGIIKKIFSKYNFFA